MPSHIKIIHAHEFIVATPEGNLDLEASRKLLGEIVASTPFKCDVLVDTRKARSEMTGSELWHLVAGLNSTNVVSSRKTAVLCPPERLDHAEILAHCAQDRGFYVRAFTSFENAYEWLTAGVADAQTT